MFSRYKSLKMPMIILAGTIPILFRQGWSQILEGQIGKQSFVAHMIESYMTGALERGFPLRFFFEPWHQGVIPWAEEVPLYHIFASTLGAITGLGAVQAGRVVSLLCVGVTAFFIRRIALNSLLIGEHFANLFAACFILLPGVQIYGSSVIPDLAMVAALVAALSSKLENRRTRSYLFLGLACAFKYYAVFSVIAFWIHDALAIQKSKGRLKEYVRSLVAPTLAVAPTLTYLVYFIFAKIPNPVTEYGANGYGHLAGPFIFKLKFYVRFLTWVFVKNPGLPFGLLSIGGAYLAFRLKNQTASFLGIRNLMGIWFLCLVLFALVFASSFFVHDYYALPFLIPIAFFGFYALSRIRYRVIQALLLVTLVVLGIVQPNGALRRHLHYLPAAEAVRKEFENIPDKSHEALLVFITDYSQPPIPVLSRKSGWSFVLDRYADQAAFLKQRLGDRRAKGVVAYFGSNSGPAFEDWRKDILQAGFREKMTLNIENNHMILFQPGSP